jgi:hypothetical protein
MKMTVPLWKVLGSEMLQGCDTADIRQTQKSGILKTIQMVMTGSASQEIRGRDNFAAGVNANPGSCPN